MYKTPSTKSKGGGWKKSKAPFTPRKKGLFEDGQWLCDCRQPALFLTVKKKGPNNGKHFYTCDNKKCDFFLWEHDAKTRERDALMTHNRLSENGVVGRIQAKGAPPATPSFAPQSTTTTRPDPPKTAPQQRTWSGAPAASSAAPSQDSDYLNYDTDEEGSEAQQAAQAQSFSGGSSQTMRNASGAGISGPAPRGRMPNFNNNNNNNNNNQEATPSAKRKRSVFLPDTDEEFGGDSLDDSDVERELAIATEESVRKKLFQTPAAERVTDRLGGGALPTPMTRTNRNSLLIADEDREGRNKRQRCEGPASIAEVDATQSQSQSQSLPAGQGHALYIGDVGTPTPYRKTDALAPTPFLSSTPPPARGTSPAKTTPNSGAAAADYPKIVDEAMALLVGQPVSEATRRSVRQALERHEMRVKGVAMGREVARAALEARQERIAELQARVVDLENARRFDRGRLKELSEGLLSLTQEEEE
ncbi:unnamed protein product [Discula destructiva]